MSFEKINIKPIDTVYNGYKFRSRLEARWAVFFDEIGIKYDYEKEGYDLGNCTAYLPDFYLPELDCFVEIKGEYNYISPFEKEKAHKLAELTHKNVYIFYGQIPVLNELNEYGNNGAAIAFLYTDNPIFGGYLNNVEMDIQYQWCQCPICFKIGIEYHGYAGRLCKCHGEKNPDHIGHHADSPTLLTAYSKARQARFEFGACG